MFYMVAECTATNCCAEFYINDIPLVRRGHDGGGPFLGAPVNEYILQERNEMSLIVEPGDEPSIALGQAGRKRHRFAEDAAVSFKIVRYPKGATVGGPDGVPIALLQWTPEPRTYHVPLTLATDFDAEESSAPFRWESVERLAGDDVEIGAAIGFLKDLATSFEMNIPQQFTSLSEDNFREIEKSYGLPPGERLATARSMFKDAFSDPDFAMKEVDASAASFRTCGQGRLLHCIQKDWDQPLAQDSDANNRMAWDLFVCRDNDSWFIAR